MQLCFCLFSCLDGLFQCFISSQNVLLTAQANVCPIGLILTLIDTNDLCAAV